MKERNSSFELLRVVSIIMITLHHLSMTVGIDCANMYVRLWGQFFYIGGKVGVNCFVLISAYFLCDLSFRVERVIKTHSKLLLYGMIGVVVGTVSLKDCLTIEILLKSFLPIIFNHYWFVTSYIGLVLISPILNMFLGRIDEREHATAIVILLVLLSIIPTFTAQTVFNSNLMWFVFLYICAAYVKWYDVKWKKVLSKSYICVLIWMLIFLGGVAFTIGERWIPALKEGTNFFTGMYIFPQFLNSLSLFLFFEKRQSKSKIIDFFGKHSFACYLIQSNCIIVLLRCELFRYIFGAYSIYLYPFIAILMSIGIFMLSTAVDVPIQCVLDSSMVKYCESWIARKTNKIFRKVTNLVLK